ncbi:helix-turn-helix domain-containing protein [Salmonella enterica]|nr:helix-turn-helix domain-containing protein [Salmonella enterica]ECD4439674.1 helix-turn-helix domain-containing protein [Salmonella enterica subsp. enterica serovar Florida]ECX3454140.1 helix-turn-helix domain-containing protein [Salmonella enterica subsp. enterica serovar Rubislaw]EDR3486646.1 helix-turn-helix domain-containing protein [Salmonella enterica subsp. enterica serovar Midway]EDX9200271.1 helix-turn-helix domain-containing protein [Salmonella enterica subsp. enterica serovar Miam
MFSTNHDPRSINSLLLCAQVALLSGSVSNTDVINVLDVAQDLISLIVTSSANNKISTTNSNKEQSTPLCAPYTADLSIGDHIQIARENLGMSEVDLAEKLNIHPGDVLTWEDGTDQPLAGMIIPLANALKCDPMWLLTGESSNHQSPATPVHQSRNQYSGQQRSDASDHASHHVKHQSQA